MSIKYLVGGSVFLAILLVLIISRPAFHKSPDRSLEDFFSHEGLEDTQMDPLILAGEKVVPLVLDRIPDRSMPKRRYAIAFLGNGSYAQAIPTLERILQDKTELDYFRGDALQSIYLINNELGLRYAQEFKAEGSHLGKVSVDLLTDKYLLPEHRSYIAALLSD